MPSLVVMWVMAIWIFRQGLPAGRTGAAVCNWWGVASSHASVGTMIAAARLCARFSESVKSKLRYGWQPFGSTAKPHLIPSCDM